jgi:hypothetical protein
MLRYKRSVFGEVNKDDDADRRAANAPPSRTADDCATDKNGTVYGECSKVEKVATGAPKALKTRQAPHPGFGDRSPRGRHKITRPREGKSPPHLIERQAAGPSQVRVLTPR